MATRRICSIDSCDKPADTGGWCKGHYARWLRHGDPLAGRTGRGKALAFVRYAAESRSVECIDWPFSRASAGYGKVGYNGKIVRANRLVCEMAHGPAPAIGYEAAHNCGNNKCVNGGHLRWSTPSENCADKVLHGTDNRGEKHNMVKLTEADVRHIRSLDGKVSRPEIGKMFGITRQHVGVIVRGQSWAWL